jgi:DNA-binding MarR family transcriptional regulator
MTELDDLTASLRDAFFALRMMQARVIAELGCTPVERGVLSQLARHGPQPVPAMARLRSISRQAMQKTVDGMIERRWLVTAENPDHARSQLIALTPAGEKLWAQIRKRESALLAGRELPVTAAELARATAVLAKLKPFFEELS